MFLRSTLVWLRSSHTNNPPWLINLASVPTRFEKVESFSIAVNISFSEILPTAFLLRNVSKKGAGGFRRHEGDSRDAGKRVGKILKNYLLSAVGLAPKSRRPLTAVRAARAAGWVEAAAP
jgi:hypothetical protein